MNHGSNVFDGAIGHQQAMLGSKLAPLDRGAVEDLPQTHPVVRMSSVKHNLDGRLDCKLAFEYPIRLISLRRNASSAFLRSARSRASRSARRTEGTSLDSRDFTT